LLILGIRAIGIGSLYQRFVICIYLVFARKKYQTLNSQILFLEFFIEKANQLNPHELLFENHLHI